MKTEELIKIINQEENKSFKVITLETAAGKTTGAIKACVKSIEDDLSKIWGKINPSHCFTKKILFVTRLRDDANNFAKSINELLKQEFSIAYIPSSEFCETHSSSTNNFYDCYNKKVIAITHATYLNLCDPKTAKHETIREYILKEFQTLIIDEQIDNVRETMVSFNLKTHEEVKLFLEKKGDITGKLYNEISDYFIQLINRYREITEKTIAFKSCLRAALKNDILSYDEDIFNKIELLQEYIKDIDVEFIDDIAMEYKSSMTKVTINQFIEYIKTIYYEMLYNDNSIICPFMSCIFSYKSEFEFLKLNNNIWLDASGKFLHMYQLNNEFFNVIDSERIIDHSKSKLLFHLENTSRSHKYNNKELSKWRKDKINYIIKNSKKKSKVLIISNKTECTQLEERHVNKIQEHFKEYTFYNFHNMRGKNDCYDYEYCYIIHTPRMIPAYYCFLYEYWTKQKLTNDDMILKGNKNWGFQNNKDLQLLMITDIASSIYQGLKRIQRNRSPKGEFHVFCNVEDSLHIIEEQLKNIVVIEDGKEKTQADIFIQLLKEIIKGQHKELQAIKKNRKGEELVIDGVYKKATLREYLGINSKSQFAEKILKDEKVINFCNKHNITINGQTLTFNN